MVDNACWLVQLLGLTCLSDPISKFSEIPIWLMLEANSRVAMVREKYLENEIFSRSGKSQGNLLMAREIKKGLGKSGNLKINSYGRQSSENSLILFGRGKDVLSQEIV